MPNILVRDLPDDVHAALQRKARQRHQSLQQFLTSELRRVAAGTSVRDVLEEVERRHGGTVGFEQALADLDAERAGR